MESLGQQLAIDLTGCDPAVLDDLEAVSAIMTQAALVAGATIVTQAFHKYSPIGVSGAVIIAESHFAIHTWPEYGFAALDLFTCGATIKTEECFRFVQEQFKATGCAVTEIKRGILPEVRGLRYKQLAS